MPKVQFNLSFVSDEDGKGRLYMEEVEDGIVKNELVTDKNGDARFIPTVPRPAVLPIITTKTSFKERIKNSFLKRK